MKRLEHQSRLGEDDGLTRWMTLKFAILCGLLGEAVEVLRLETGGMSPPDWRLRATLAIAYTVGAAVIMAAATVFTRRTRNRLTIAITGFAVLLFLPWLNFDYLPRFFSVRTLAGSALAVVLLAVLAPAIARFRKSVASAVLVLAVIANAGAFFGADGQPITNHATERVAPAVNVAVLLIDTLRADHLGAYGYERATSPHFDRLAQSSVLFERAVAQASWTKPSVASLLTGTYVHHHGVISSRDALGPELPTLAEKLRANGYRTAAFSANPWITPEFRFDRGFDTFESGRAMGAQLTNLYRLLMRGRRVFRGLGVRLDLPGLVFWGVSEDNASNAHRDKLLTDAVVDWLGENDGDPFFLYVHLIGSHDPYDPPADYVRPFREAGWAEAPARTQPPPRVQSIFDVARPLDRTALANLLAQYDGAIAYTDSLIGRIVAELERSRLLNRTLLVVTSDHGEEFYEHRNWRHGNQLYDEVVHVPLAIRLPERLEAGRKTDAAMLVDIFPTVFGVLDLPLDLPHQDGRDLFAPLMSPAPPVFSEHWRFEGGKYVSRMVSRGELKLKETYDSARRESRVELYHLGADPREQHNLAAGDALALSENGVGELRGLLAAFSENPPAKSGLTVDIDRSTKERLRALGY